jgi:hypothetical protein
MVASEPVLSGGAAFQVETEDLWTTGNLSHIPVDLRLRITNQSDTDLMVPFMDTFVPVIVYPNGKEKVLEGNRTLTKPVMRPLLLRPGQDYSIVHAAYLREDHSKLRLSYEDGTGSSAGCDLSVAGKYQLRFRYSVAKKWVEQAANEAPSKTMWTGTVTTNPVIFEVVLPDRPSSEVPR